MLSVRHGEDEPGVIGREEGLNPQSFNKVWPVSNLAASSCHFIEGYLLFEGYNKIISNFEDRVRD